MKKIKLIKFFKLGVLFLLISILLWNCEQEQIVLQNQDALFKTVSTNEVISFLKINYLPKKSTQKNNQNLLDLSYTLNTINQEAILNSTELMTILPATTKYKNLFSRILFLKIKDTIQATVFHMESDAYATSKKFSGKLAITDLLGNFLVGYKIKDDTIVSKFTRSINNYQLKGNTNDCDEGADDRSIFCNQALNEIIITATVKEGINVKHFFFYDTDYDTNYGEEIWDFNNSGGGGSGNTSGDDDKKNEEECNQLGMTYDPILKNCVEVVVKGPDEPIENLEEFLECIDQTKEAVVTISAKQPDPNDPDDNYTKDYSVGHAFVTISQGQYRLSYGFYPKEGVGYLNPTEGIMGRNQNYPYHVSVTDTISSGTLNNLITLSLDYGTAEYSLQAQNCTDFAISAAITIGLNINKAECIGSYGVGSGATPGKFGAYLKNMNLPSGVTSKKELATSLSNKECD